MTPGVYCRQVGGIHSDYDSLFFLFVFLPAYPIIPFYNSSLYNSHPPGLFLFFGNAEEKSLFLPHERSSVISRFSSDAHSSLG